MYSLAVQGARSLKSRCWQGHTPSKGTRGDPSLLLLVPGASDLCFRLHAAFSSLSYEDTCNFFVFWLCHVACGILVPPPGLKPEPPAVVVWSLNHWTAREVPGHLSLDLRPTQVIQDDLISRSLIVSEKTLFLNKIRTWSCLFWGYHSTHYTDLPE